LQPRGFPNREVTETAIGFEKSVFSAGHPMVPGLKRLCGFVKQASRVTHIATCASIVS